MVVIVSLATVVIVSLATVVIAIDMGRLDMTGLIRTTMVIVISAASLIYGACAVVVPAAWLMTPLFLIALAIGFPAIWNPMLILARLHPAARRPNMLIVLDLPIARRPSVARPRCGNELILGSRRRPKIDVQVDLRRGWGENRRGDHCRGREKGRRDRKSVV